jgi:hypothetical protein
MRIVTSTTIPADTKTVWQRFLAVEKWPEWSPWGLQFLHEPRFEVGARFFVAVPAPLLPFITLRFPCRVTALENPHVICWTGKVLGVSGFHRFTLQETPEGCHVLSEEEFRRPLALLLWPMRSMFHRRVVEFLSRLKSATDEIGHASPNRP